MQRALFTIGNVKVWVYNVHLNASRKGESERLKEIKYLLRWIKSINAVNCIEIVVGDFNMEPKERGYSLMHRAGFRSAMKTLRGREELTYPSGLKSMFVAQVGPYTLDYIWYRGVKGGKIECISAELVGN